jgi:hypothetical protein
MSEQTSTVIEVTSYKSQHTGTPAEVIARLIAIQWVIEEELPDRTTLVHELIPGARRIVLHT